MTDYLDSDRARLEMAVPRTFKRDPVLDNALRLFREDRPAFNALPAAVKSQVGIYCDFADAHAAAVQAGVIPDDRGPDAA